MSTDKINDTEVVVLIYNGILPSYILKKRNTFESVLMKYIRLLYRLK